MTRQAASQLLREIERRGCVELRDSPHDTRARRVRFTARGRRLLDTVIELVEEMDEEFAAILPPGEFERGCAAMFRISERVDPGGALADDARGHLGRVGQVGQVGRKGQVGRTGRTGRKGQRRSRPT